MGNTVGSAGFRSFVVSLVEVDTFQVYEVGVPQLLVRTIPGEVSLFAAAEAGIVGVFTLVGLGNLSSGSVSKASVSSSPIVWGASPTQVHANWLVVHPTWGVGRVVLQLLWLLLLLVPPVIILGEEGASLSLLCVGEWGSWLELRELRSRSQKVIQQLVGFTAFHRSLFHLFICEDVGWFEYVCEYVPW